MPLGWFFHNLAQQTSWNAIPLRNLLVFPHLHIGLLCHIFLMCVWQAAASTYTFLHIKHTYWADAPISSIFTKLMLQFHERHKWLSIQEYTRAGDLEAFKCGHLLLLLWLFLLLVYCNCNYITITIFDIIISCPV